MQFEGLALAHFVLADVAVVEASLDDDAGGRDRGGPLVADLRLSELADRAALGVEESLVDELAVDERQRFGAHRVGQWFLVPERHLRAREREREAGLCAPAGKGGERPFLVAIVAREDTFQRRQPRRVRRRQLLRDGRHLAERPERVRGDRRRRRRVDDAPGDLDELEGDRLGLVEPVEQEGHRVALVRVGELARGRLEVVLGLALLVAAGADLADAHAVGASRRFDRLVVGHLGVGAVLTEVVARRRCRVAAAGVGIGAGGEEPEAAAGVAVEVPLALLGVVVLTPVDDVLVAHQRAQRPQAVLLFADLLAAVAEVGLRVEAEPAAPIRGLQAHLLTRQQRGGVRDFAETERPGAAREARVERDLDLHRHPALVTHRRREHEASPEVDHIAAGFGAQLRAARKVVETRQARFARHGPLPMVDDAPAGRAASCRHLQ